MNPAVESAIPGRLQNLIDRFLTIPLGIAVGSQLVGQQTHPLDDRAVIHVDHARGRVEVERGHADVDVADLLRSLDLAAGPIDRRKLGGHPLHHGERVGGEVLDELRQGVVESRLG